MRSSLSDIFGTIMGILIISTWINGCIHSNKKHSDDSFFMEEGPGALYRGVEYFWHDDFADVNWEDRIKSDVATSVDLISSVKEKYKIDGVRQEIEKFSKRISDYPKDKIDSIKLGVKKFIRFNECMGNDFYQYVMHFNPKIDFQFTPSCQLLIDSLNSYYHLGGIESLQKVIDSIVIQIKHDTSNLHLYQERISNSNRFDLDIYSEPYYRIFKEKLTR